mmetsp:Transcript_11163/g.21588  ORF Transcript_11163/g.21588 Transcript_11163/m.21588 type:complete len:306 (-) Transcript_11163:37-954(-)
MKDQQKHTDGDETESALQSNTFQRSRFVLGEDLLLSNKKTGSKDLRSHNENQPQKDTTLQRDFLTRSRKQNGRQTDDGNTNENSEKSKPLVHGQAASEEENRRDPSEDHNRSSQHLIDARRYTSCKSGHHQNCRGHVTCCWDPQEKVRSSMQRASAVHAVRVCLSTSAQKGFSNEPSRAGHTVQGLTRRPPLVGPEGSRVDQQTGKLSNKHHQRLPDRLLVQDRFLPIAVGDTLAILKLGEKSVGGTRYKHQGDDGNDVKLHLGMLKLTQIEDQGAKETDDPSLYRNRRNSRDQLTERPRKRKSR